MYDSSTFVNKLDGLSWFGVVLLGNIGRLDGIMDAEKYSHVLIQQSIPSGKYLTVNGFIFQRDKIPSTL